MKPNENININNLLAKYFSNEKLSPIEKKQFTEWKQENAKEYKHIKKLLAKENSPISINTDEAWQKVLAKIKSTNKKNFFLYNNFFSYGIAASLLLFIGILAWIYTSNSSYKEYYNPNLITETYVLPDNSTVSLNSNTLLRYYKNTKKKRLLKLLYGEAFFEVQPNKQKPFIIETPNAKVQVLGTSFNLKADSNVTNIFVKTGIVSLTNNKKDTLTLVKGEQGIVNNETFSKKPITDENYLAWKVRKLVLKNISLYDAVPLLENYYHVKINAPQESRNCYFTTTFTNETLKEALNELQLLMSFNYRIRENKVELYQINCE